MAPLNYEISAVKGNGSRPKQGKTGNRYSVNGNRKKAVGSWQLSGN
jgi:hypothetical protein